MIYCGDCGTSTRIVIMFGSDGVINSNNPHLTNDDVSDLINSLAYSECPHCSGLSERLSAKIQHGINADVL